MTTPLHGNPSKTAFNASMLRAFATKEEDPNIQGSDSLAYLFLDETLAAIYRDDEKRLNYLEKNYKAGGYAYMIARTKLIDHLFQSALQENLPQIVFLGAGFDTRAWRFHDLIQETQVFELDLPVTQQWKQTCFAQSKIPTPSAVHWVPTTFNFDSLASDLQQAGYYPDKQTFFILEGLTYYLTEDAIEETLNFISSNTCLGSTLILDYVHRYVVECNWMVRVDAITGEPFRFGINQDQIEYFLSLKGFKLIQNYSPSMLENQFLMKSNGELFKPSIPFFGLAHARVEEKED